MVLEKLGISVDYWTSTGNAMALSELNLKYFTPLRVLVCLHTIQGVSSYHGSVSQNLLIFLYLASTSSERRQVRRQGEACANQRRANDRGAHDRDPAGSQGAHELEAHAVYYITV